MHSIPKKTIDVIEAQGNSYVIQTKKNQRHLFEHLKAVISKKDYTSKYVSSEVQKGRKEKRTTKVYPLLPEDLPKKWQTTQMCVVIEIERFRETKEHTSCEKHLYISNLGKKKAKDFASFIREHWSIENHLHWVKDAILKEDTSTMAHKDAAITCAVLRTITLNLFRIHNYNSIKNAIIKLANKISTLYTMFRT